MISVGILGAFVGGVLSLLSPCAALLLPAFFAYAFTSLRQLARQTFVFFLGLCATLVPIGTGLAAVLSTHRDQAIAVGGWLLIFFGAYAALGFGFNIPWLARFQNRSSTFLLGAVYGFAGFCAGPLLGAVLTTAASSGSAAYGALIMAFYALGMAAPLFLLALLWDRFSLADAAFLRGRPITLGPVRTNTLSVLAGAVFIAIGVLFIRSHGAASLPTLLDIDAQFAVQEWAARATGAFGDAWVLLALSLVATALVGRVAFRSAR